MADTQEYEEYEESWTGRIIVAAVVAVALIAGAFFAGRAMAGSGGPSTLAEAVEQARAGDLPCGETAAPTGTPTGDDAQGRPPGGGGFPVAALCRRAGQQQQSGQAGGRFGGGPGGFGQTGRVTAVSADSITVEGPMGATAVKVDDATAVNTTATGALADVKTGDSVLIAGAGRDGAAATSITILPGTN